MGFIPKTSDVINRYNTQKYPQRNDDSAPQFGVICKCLNDYPQIVPISFRSYTGVMHRLITDQ